ncbi:hypothetical protein FOPE_07705 [Fonsecaea pedrosoi]|nr:hypothetical protein FOPE_07705 [Fonsecaea pedrosoi]
MWPGASTKRESGAMQFALERALTSMHSRIRGPYGCKSPFSTISLSLSPNLKKRLDANSYLWNDRAVLNVHFNPQSTGTLDGQDGPIATGPIDPKEVANVLVFLASDLSSAINGAVVPVDKAWSAA